MRSLRLKGDERVGAAGASTLGDTLKVMQLCLKGEVVLLCTNELFSLRV